jgi:hypothetical protein
MRTEDSIPKSRSKSSGHLPIGERLPNFESMMQVDVPQGRNGKHRDVVNRILDDLFHLESGRAIRIPLDGLKDSKENIRAALSRETRKRGIVIHTAADIQFLYVWSSQ